MSELITRERARALLEGAPAPRRLTFEAVRDGAHVYIDEQGIYVDDDLPVCLDEGEAALYDDAHALATTVVAQAAEIDRLNTVIEEKDSLESELESARSDVAMLRVQSRKAASIIDALRADLTALRALHEAPSSSPTDALSRPLADAGAVDATGR